MVVAKVLLLIFEAIVKGTMILASPFKVDGTTVEDIFNLGLGLLISDQIDKVGAIVIA